MYIMSRRVAATSSSTLSIAFCLFQDSSLEDFWPFQVLCVTLLVTWQNNTYFLFKSTWVRRSPTSSLAVILCFPLCKLCILWSFGGVMKCKSAVPYLSQVISGKLLFIVIWMWIRKKKKSARLINKVRCVLNLSPFSFSCKGNLGKTQDDIVISRYSPGCIHILLVNHAKQAKKISDPRTIKCRHHYTWCNYLTLRSLQKSVIWARKTLVPV